MPRRPHNRLIDAQEVVDPFERATQLLAELVVRYACARARHPAEDRSREVAHEVKSREPTAHSPEKTGIKSP
jgi:hypothetical protein